MKSKFLLEYTFSASNDVIIVDITHKKTMSQFQIVVDNPDILTNIEQTINEYLLKIESDIRHDLISKII